MRKIRSSGAVAIRPVITLSTPAGYYAHPVTPTDQATVIDDVQLNSMTDEMLNAVQGVLGQGENPNDDTQLLQCFRAVQSGISINTAGLYVPIAGGHISGGIGLTIAANNSTGNSLDTSGPVQITNSLKVAPNANTAGQGGLLTLQGGGYSATTINNTAYIAGTAPGVNVDAAYFQGSGNTLRAYSAAFVAGSPILNYFVDTGMLHVRDVTLDSVSLSVANTLAAIGNGGNLFVRQVGSTATRTITFLNSDPGTVDGQPTGVIGQFPVNAPTNADLIYISANGDGSNGTTISPSGAVSMPGTTTNALGYLTPGYSNQYADGTPGTRSFSVPANVYRIRITATGGGGGGDGNQNKNDGNFVSGGGGGAGGTSINDISVTPGQAIQYNVGSGGTAGYFNGPNGYVSAQPGTSTICYGVNAAATGGQGAYYNASNSSNGGSPGLGTTGLELYGGYGSDGMAGPLIFAGNGGASAWGGGGRAGTAGGLAGIAPGSGGGGGYGIGGSQTAGGVGGNGFIVIQW